MKKVHLFLVFVFVIIPLVMVMALRNFAGNPTPTDPPASTMSYALGDIYDELNNGSGGDRTVFTEPTSGPGTPTMRTLDEIMDQVPCKCSSYPTLGRWCDNGDGTVTDMTNCLVWLKKADWGGAYPWREPADYTHNDDAHTRAGLLAAGSSGADLSDGSVAGDWRLPTKEELYTFTHGSWPQSVYDPIRVTGLPASGDIKFWTSTTDQSDITKAHFVVLTDEVGTNGIVFSISKEYDNLPGIYVWPVRNY